MDPQQTITLITGANKGLGHETARRLVAAGFSTKAVWAVLRSWGSPLEETDLTGSDD